MALIPWIDSVRQQKQLRIYADNSMNSRPWSGLFNKALDEFNKLSKKYRLGVTLTASKKKSVAEVKVSTYKSIYKIGKTSLREIEHKGLFECLVTVPDQPKIKTASGERLAGPGICLVILMHEFVHCCGLTDKEHSKSLSIFQSHIDVDYGTTPDKDRVEYKRRNEKGKTKRSYMPPFVISKETVQLIRKQWQQKKTSHLSIPQPVKEGRRLIGTNTRYATLVSSSGVKCYDKHTRFRTPGSLGTRV